ncbi:hypothetical protein OIU84_019711 [Salix udensis]|uniref:HMG box domain-containing protein n=1 Tax=Salix udensis TaxID=889485 RepID=A0AAD6KZN5_9ROSI|nr:hypothetical protein OIU84_019711 [Salix udensis]
MISYLKIHSWLCNATHCREEFRKIYKQENPNVKAVSAVGKAGGEKWKSLSAAVLHKPETAVPTGTGRAPRTCSMALELCWHGHANASVEKAPYEAKAAKRKSDYEKLMTAYNKKQETDDGDDDDKDHDIEQSHKSKSEVNGQNDESDEGDEDGDDDEDDDDD